jgi:hypothetical protein
MNALTPEQREARLPLWCALASLFLDTEVTDADVAYIARVVGEAGIGAREAERVLRQEVAPVFYLNLLSVAGEWTPWRQDFVRERIAAHRSSRGKGGRGLLARLAWIMIKKDWMRVAAALERNRHAG